MPPLLSFGAKLATGLVFKNNTPGEFTAPNGPYVESKEGPTVEATHAREILKVPTLNCDAGVPVEAWTGKNN